MIDLSFRLLCLNCQDLYSGGQELKIRIHPTAKSSSVQLYYKHTLLLHTSQGIQLSQNALLVPSTAQLYLSRLKCVVSCNHNS